MRAAAPYSVSYSTVELYVQCKVKYCVAIRVAAPYSKLQYSGAIHADALYSVSYSTVELYVQTPIQCKVKYSVAMRAAAPGSGKPLSGARLASGAYSRSLLWCVWSLLCVV